MLKKVVKRILISIPVLIGVVLAIFVMLRIVPGNPVTTMMGEHVNPAVIEKISKEMGLDQPYYIQFLKYIANALRGDFGTSYRLNRNVTQIIIEAFPNTVKLSLLAAAVSWLIDCSRDCGGNPAEPSSGSAFYGMRADGSFHAGIYDGVGASVCICL